MRHPSFLRSLVGLLALAVVSAARADKPVTVPVSHPVQREFTDSEHFTGRLEAVRSVQLRARVTSYLEKTVFQEGSRVKKNDLLFVLDSRPYRAQCDRAKAGVVLAEARLKRLEVDFRRVTALRAKGVVSQEELDKIAADRAEAAATVQAARASAEVALLNLEFTQVRAPFDGLISRRLVDPGNLVKGDETVLATLVSADPMYCYFDMDERTYLRCRRFLRDDKGGGTKLPVFLGLTAEKGFPHKGSLDLIANRFDERTGTIRLRSVFANAEGRFVPGMFARVRLPLGKPRKVLVVPELAVLSKDGGKFVYLIGDDKKVRLWRVKLGPLDGDWRVIEKGLAPGVWVAVSALGRFAEGDTVEPKRVPLPGGDKE